MDLIKFEGANCRETDDGREYISRGPIWVNPLTITGVYDHTILTIGGFKIRVMEDLKQILSILH